MNSPALTTGCCLGKLLRRTTTGNPKREAETEADMMRGTNCLRHCLRPAQQARVANVPRLRIAAATTGKCQSQRQHRPANLAQRLILMGNARHRRLPVGAG
jgi:hypothetical protein